MVMDHGDTAFGPLCFAKCPVVPFWNPSLNTGKAAAYAAAFLFVRIPQIADKNIVFVFWERDIYVHNRRTKTEKIYCNMWIIGVD